MDPLHSMRGDEIAGHLGDDDKIDFFFDEQSEKNQIMAAWEAFTEAREDETRARFGVTPRFEKEEEFKPLQAADFWAWWVRKWAMEGALHDPARLQFYWEQTREIPKIIITANEDELVGMFGTYLRQMIGPDRPIYDSEGRVADRPPA